MDSVDCIFRAENLNPDPTHHYFNLPASHTSDRVGFSVKMVRSIGPGSDDDINLVQSNVYRHGVFFRSRRWAPWV